MVSANRINRIRPIRVYTTMVHQQVVTIRVYTSAHLGAPRKNFPKKLKTQFGRKPESKRQG